MIDRRLNPAPVALAFLIALTVTACGQSPTGAPSASTASTGDVAASGLFRSTEEKAVIQFLKAVANARQVTKIEVSKAEIGYRFTATAKVVNPGSMFWPQYDEQRWEGHMCIVGRDSYRRMLIQGRYLDALAGQQQGPGPWMKKVVEI